MADEPIITLEETGRKCLADPCFLIEWKGAVYLAVAVLEYDEKQAQDPQQQEGVAKLKKLFQDGFDKKKLRACAINTDGSFPPPEDDGPAPSAAELGNLSASAGGGGGGSSAGPGAGGGPDGPPGGGGPGNEPPGPPPPAPPPAPPSPLDPPGMQSEPPGMQTDPPP